MNTHTLFFCIGCLLFSLFIYTPQFYSEQTQYSVYFCPKDNCTSILLDELESAKNISCAFYDIDQKNITHVLKEKNAIVYVDSDTKTTFGLKRKTPGLMHHKFCILDSYKVISGSTNPTENGLTKNRNNLLIITSPSIAREFQKEFEELTHEVYKKGERSSHDDIFFCPEDNCEETIVRAIDDAKESIFMMVFTFTSTKIANHLILANQRGVNVSVIFENRQRSYWQADFLSYQGISTNIYKQKGAILHHKVFLIDNITYTGSYNPTNAANTINEENIIRIDNHSVYSAFYEEFRTLLTLSQPLNIT